MATKEAVFSLRVETGNSVQDVQNFDKAVGNLNKDIKQVQQTAQQSTGIDSFDAKLQELNARVEAGGLTMRELTQTMKAYQTIAAQAGMESPVGQQAIQAAGQLKDQIGDLKAATTALSSDFVGLDTALAGIETGAAVFQGFQSAIALTGVENEKLVQTMVKLQAVQGVVNAVNTVAKNLNSDAILGIQVRNGLEKIGNFIRTGTITGLTAQATAQGAVTAATASTTVAMKALRTAIIATGIGALVIGLIAAAEALGLFGDETESAEKAQKKMADAVELTNKRLQDQSKYTSDLVEGVGRDTEKLVAQAKLRGATEQEIGKIIKEQSDIQRRLLANDVEFQRKEYYKAVNNRKINLEQLTKFEETYFAARKKLNDFDSKQTLDSLNAQIDAQNKAKEAAKKAADQRKTDLEKVRAAEKEYTISLLTDKEQEILKENQKYAELIKLAQKYGQDTTTLQLALKNALNEINLKYAQIEIDTAQKIADDQLKILQQQKEREEKIMSDMQAADDKAWDIEKSKMDLHAKYIKNEEDRAIAERENAYQTELYDLQNALDKKLLTEEEYQNAVKVATQRFEEDRSKITMDADLKRLDHMIQQAQKVKDMVGQIFQVITDFENIRLQEIENNTNAELAALDKKYQDELNKGNLNSEQKAALDKNYAKAKYDTELKAFNEMEKIKKRQFNRDKALRIAQVAIDTAAAVSKSVAASPLTFGMPWSAAAVGIGLAQIAAIAATKYESGTAPSLSTGGGAGVSAGASGSDLGGAAVNGSLAGQQMSTAELVSQTNQGNVYVLESDITGTQNKVATQNKLSVW